MKGKLYICTNRGFMGRRTTKEEFIAKATKIHEGKYDYSKVELVNMNARVTVICPEHGEFQVVPTQHIHKNDQVGCKECGKKNQGKRKSLEEVLQDFRKVHGDKYDYSGVQYKTMHNDVTIGCKVCNKTFEQRPYAHIQGQGCPICGLANRRSPLRKTTEKFIEQAKSRWENLYNYDKTKYLNKNTKIKYDCPKHGEIEQKPKLHINSGCPFCNGRGISKHSKLTFTHLANLVHNNKYNYSAVEYKGMGKNLEVICPTHGSFWQTPANHVHNKTGCPKCDAIKSSSRAEKSVLDFIRQNYAGEIIENDRKVLDGKEMDVYIPSLKLGLEYHGMYFHVETAYGKKRHWEKANKADEKGIRLIQIYEYEWEQKPEIVKSKILSILGKNTIIGARETEAMRISFKLKNEFLDENHLQGRDNVKERNCYCLIYKDKIVSCMTFGPSRYNRKYDWELTRFCTAKGMSIQHGAEKLLTHFKRECGGSIISYADRRWSTGGVYRELGFTLDGITKPGFDYYHLNKKQLENRRNYQKKNLTEMPEYDINLTEYEIMQLNGYDRIWNAGQLRFVMK